MSREILFKAKRKDNSEWVEGYLYKHQYFAFIFPLVTNGSYDNSKKVMNFMNPCFEVDPYTICQYTGLMDKNGNKIWENDVVRFHYPFECLEHNQYDNGYSVHYCTGQVLWDKETASFQVTERISAENYEVLDDCKVIGNAFDNPELLEV